MSTIEIRFQSNIGEDEVLSTFYPVFGKSFAKVVNRGIPRELKMTDPNLQFTTDYVFSNKDYSVSVGKNCISFENIGTYHLWSNYFPMVKENLTLLRGMNVVTGIVRIGLRYASIFEGETVLSNVIKYNFGIALPGYIEKPKVYQSNFSVGDINLLLQVLPEATSNSNGVLKKGIYIDIDASINGHEGLQIEDEAYQIIDDLHTEEKKLFFSLLRAEFIKTLNPKY